MTRILIALVAAALLGGAYALTTAQPISAQQGGPSVCLSLPAGDHTFTAPSQDREGEVSFTVTVGEGGLVTSFTEPGGQSVPPAALLQIFTGEDAYPLPEGVSFIECEAAQSDSMAEDAPAPVCVSLPAGSHSATVSAGGQSYEITIDVGDHSEVIGVTVLGQTYNAQDALDLLAGFGAVLPPQVRIIECPADTMPEASDGNSQAAYPYTGSGGLADSPDRTALWAGLGALGFVAIAAAAGVQRRRVKVHNRD